MAIPRHHLAIPGDECQCGRRASLMHCTNCGSSRIYARMNRYHKCMDGEIRLVPVQYRCQTCAHEFIPEEREFCEASPVTEALARQKARVLHEALAGDSEMTPQQEQILKRVANEVPSSNQPVQTPREKYQAFRRIEIQLQGAYADEKIKLSHEGKKIGESLDDFVARHLAEMKVQRVEKPKED